MSFLCPCVVYTLLYAVSFKTFVSEISKLLIEYTPITTTGNLVFFKARLHKVYLEGRECVNGRKAEDMVECELRRKK